MSQHGSKEYQRICMKNYRHFNFNAFADICRKFLENFRKYLKGTSTLKNIPRKTNIYLK